MFNLHPARRVAGALIYRVGRCARISSSQIRNSSEVGIQQFRLADIGEGIAEVELLKWFVKEGDSIKSFDRICEVQSDKATVEITSRYDGKIQAIHHTEGSIVKVGAVLVDISQTTTVQNKLSSGEKQVELVGTPTEEPRAIPTVFSREPSIGSGDRAQATPAVRKIAKENGIDLNHIAGSGPRGRILKEDVSRLIGNIPFRRSANDLAAPQVASPKPRPETASTIAPKHIQQATSPSEDIRVPIRGVQRLMVKSMTAALDVQHLTYCEEIVVDKLVQLRRDLKDASAAHGIKISYMPLMIKAVSIALTKFPSLNATVSPDVTEVIHHAHHNIGVAMDTPKGLIVPVIKHVQSKSIFELAQELASLQDMAKSGTLTEQHLQGGTFTLSNIGSVGGTYAVPVLVIPQVAIGAFGRFQVVPKYLRSDGNAASMEEILEKNIQPKPSTVLTVSWSADHRVVDGATVAKFSNAWKALLENPQLMLAELR